MQKENPLLLVPVIPLRPGIPKTVHLNFKDWESVPEEIKENIARMKALNPGWEFKFYSHEDAKKFIKKHYGDRMLAYYCRINPEYYAARSDLFRYLCVYAQGGVYLDIKSSMLRPLDEVLLPNDSYILSHWDNLPGRKYDGVALYPAIFGGKIARGEYQQWHVISSRGHPYLRAVLANVLTSISKYREDVSGVGKIGTLITTGPIIYTLSIHAMLDAAPHRFVEIERDLGVSYSLYEGRDDHQHRMHGKLSTDISEHYSSKTSSIIRSLDAAKGELAQYTRKKN